MRIAYVVSQFPKLSETFILREMLALRARGHDITVLSIKGDTEPMVHPEAEALRPGTLYPSLDPGALVAAAARLAGRPVSTGRVVATLGAVCAAHPGILLKSLALVPLALRFARSLEAAGVRHIHAHWATYPATLAWVIHRLTGIPYSVTGHAHDLYLPNPMLPRTLRESAFFATISEFNRALLIQSCGPEALGKVRLVRCGLPLGDFPWRPSDGPRGDPPLVVSVGRLVDYKGFDVLLRACALARDAGRPVRLRIAGEGPERLRLERLRASLRLEGLVTLEGALRQEEVRALLQTADLFVLACVRGRDGQQDGIPIVLMEAMALGVPVVSTRLSGIPELVKDSETGLLAAPGDDRHLADVMGRILQDRVLSLALAQRARELVEREFDIERSVTALCHEFERAAARRAA